MYRMLQRNLKGYFSLYEKGDTKYRFQVVEVLQGLMSKELYDKWKTEEPEKYQELSNIVYQMKEYVGQFPRFETLSWDLWGMDYDAIKNEKFSNEHLIEKLKIINLCLGGAYLE